MSAGANTTSAAGRARNAGLVVSCLMIGLFGPLRAESLDVRRITTTQSTPGELAGPTRPDHHAVRTQHQTVELSNDAYVSGLVPAILFAPGSAHLTPSATRILDNLGQSLTAPSLAADRFRIEGHTDTFGSADANRDLAARRAKAVVDYLEQNCGISPGRLEAVASLKPLAPTGEGVRLGMNRRVRFINLGR